MLILQEWAFISIHRWISDLLHQAAQAAEVQVPVVRHAVLTRFAYMLDFEFFEFELIYSLT